ncbi:MAG: hypothetical protein AAFP82_12665, partial [Bacteroidota bacterium]
MQENLINRIKAGVELLEERQGYNQADILRRLKTLNKGISPASMSNILNNKEVGPKILNKVKEGVEMIILEEIGMYYAERSKSFQLTTNAALPTWNPNPIEPTKQEKEERGYIYHDTGRLPLDQKLDFLEQAQKEIIEVGVRLNTLSSHFEHRSGHEFKDRITALLERGVNIKFYLLEPSSGEALLYFRDRSTANFQKQEAQSTEVIKAAIEKLKLVVQEYQALNLKGQLELYAYKHIPYNNFLIIDGETEQGHMRVSHYLYGIRRADSPVVRN